MAVGNLKANKIATSKRRGNLFKKAAELSTLCGAQVAIVAISEKGKVSVFPNSNTVIRRYLDGKGCAKKRADEKADVEKKELTNHAAGEEGVIGHSLLDLNLTLALQYD